MPDMPNVDLDGIMKHLTETGKRTHQLWLTPDSMAFIARGREYRSEFHINPSYEIQYSIKGDLRLHYRTPEGGLRSARVASSITQCTWILYALAGTCRIRTSPGVHLLILFRRYFHRRKLTPLRSNARPRIRFGSIPQSGSTDFLRGLS